MTQWFQNLPVLQVSLGLFHNFQKQMQILGGLEKKEEKAWGKKLAGTM